MKATSAPTVSLVNAWAARAMAKEPDTLALVRFGGSRSTGERNSPWINTGITTLGPGRAPVQCWRTRGPVRHMRAGEFAVHAAPGIAMLATTLPDQEDPAAGAEEVYRRLFAIATELGCPHLLRIWQYLPRITEPCIGEDRYRRFCAGRRAAFTAVGRPDSALPAACLLGNTHDAILLYALVAACPGTQVENPRQVSAFLYPPQYGRASPSFSRALAQTWPDGTRQLYISGTASVVGHASVHHGILPQLDEILNNLEAVLEAGRERGGPPAMELADIAPLTVYLRRRTDYATVRQALERRLPKAHPTVYLRADICRADLLVEIEGVASMPAPTP